MQAGKILRESGCGLVLATTWLAATVPSQSDVPTTRPAASKPSADVDRTLRFAWPRVGRAHVVSDHAREVRGSGEGEADEKQTFRLEFDLDLAEGPTDSEIRVGRRGVRVTRWNGQAVPPSERSILAPLELRTELLPDLLVDNFGRIRGLEPEADFTRRVEATIQANESLDESAAAALRRMYARADRATLGLRAQKAWDEWLGRWNDLDFRERDSAEFVGEIELPTGDVVDGTFTARHFGATPDLDGHVRLLLQFEASGPRLDLAAIRWRQRLLDVGDEPFEIISLEFRETCECVLRPESMQPASVTTTRETTIRDGDDSQTIVETTHWQFTW